MDVKAQTQILLKRYSDEQNHEAKVKIRNQILELNADLIRSKAHSIERGVRGQGHEFIDLYQVGTIGAIKAIERFDITSGRAFSSYAVPYINGEMLRYLRDKASLVRLPRKWSDAQSKIRKMERERVSKAEMAQRLKWPIEELEQCLIAIARLPHKDIYDERLEQKSDYQYYDSIFTEWDIPTREDGWVNATAVCKQFGKEFRFYWRLLKTKKRVVEIQKTCTKSTFLYEISRGRKGGTFLHPLLAAHFLEWVDERFSLIFHERGIESGSSS